MNYTFNNCSLLNYLNISTFKTNKVKTLVSMFNSCSSLTSLSLPYFDTSKLKDNEMDYIFEGCTNLKLSIDKEKCSNLIKILPDYVEIIN